MTRALEAAISLGRDGLRCFSCRADKTPACEHGFKDALSGADELQALWRRYPGPLVGVATGEASGFDALDLDRKHPAAVSWWAQNRDRIPPTRAHRTKSGGLHLLFRHTPGMRCWAGRPAVGVDGRGDGGYIIWWPAAGFRVLCEAPLSPWPEWLLDEVSPPRPSAAPSVTVSWRPQPTLTDDEAQFRYAEAALRSGTERVGRAGEGTRNHTLNSEAHGLGRLVAAGLIEGQRVADALAAAAIDAGLAPHEVAATLRSAFRARGLA